MNENAHEAFFKDKVKGQSIGRQGATRLVPIKELTHFLETKPTLAQLEDKLGFASGVFIDLKDKISQKVIGKAQRVYIYEVKAPLALDLTLPDAKTMGVNECYLGGGNICTGKDKAVSFNEVVATAPVPYETMTEYQHH